MKVLLISDVYFPRINGVSTSIRTFTEQQQLLGHTELLIAPDYGIKTIDEAWITRVPARSIYFDPEDKLIKYGELLKLLPSLKTQHFDLIHIHTPFIAHYAGLKLAKLLQIPVVETYHTFLRIICIIICRGFQALLRAVWRVLFLEGNAIKWTLLWRHRSQC